MQHYRSARSFCYTLCCVFGVVAMSTGVAHAQTPLAVTLESYLVTEVTLEDGTVEEQLVPTETAEPGQVLEYHLTLQNESETVIPEGVAAMGPVPERTQYLAESATDGSGSDLTFSADEGESFSAAPTVTVTDENGDEQEVAAEPEQYDAVRWLLLSELEPGQTRTFVYRVEVL